MGWRSDRHRSIVQRLCVVAGTSVVLAASAASAQTGDVAGFIGVLGPIDRADIAVEIQGLARTGPLFGRRFGLQAAGAVTTDRALSAHLGVFGEYRPTDSWSVIASTGPSVFDNGRGRNLGSDFAFQSQLEITRRVFDEKLWVGVFLSHRSNAGFADTNPGDETVGVVVHVRDSWTTPFDLLQARRTAHTDHRR